MKRLRVGIVTYGLDRPLTGIGRYSAELIKSLAALDSPPELTLLTPATPAYLPDYAQYPRCQLGGCRHLPALLTYGSLLIRRAVGILGLDVIHDPTGQAPFLFGAHDARQVLTIHDVFAVSFPGTSTTAEWFVTRCWLPVILRRLDAIITDSMNTRQDVTERLHVPPEDISVVPLAPSHSFKPVDPKKAVPTLRRYGLEPGYLLVVVGAQDRRRNLPRLLAAYDLLAKEGEKRPLVIIGKSHRSISARAETAPLPAARPDRRVVNLGYVPEVDLPLLYAAAGLFVFPSLYEGFGLPVLEAMACGTPVACSNTSSLPEVAGEAALMFNPYRVEEIASAIRQVLADDDLRYHLHTRGLKRAAQFSWQRTARETLRIYQSLLIN